MSGHGQIAKISSNTICSLHVGRQQYLCCFMCVLVGLKNVDELEVFHIDLCYGPTLNVQRTVFFLSGQSL